MKGVLITTSDFTAAACEFAKGTPLELVNGAELEGLLGRSDRGKQT